MSLLILVLVAVVVGICVFIGLRWWSVHAKLARRFSRQAAIRRVEWEAELRLHQTAYRALQQLLDEARRQQ